MTSEAELVREQHLATARHLAAEMGMPAETVLEVYEREFERLSASANITQFLDVITVKHVKDTIRSLRSTGLQAVLK